MKILPALLLVLITSFAFPTPTSAQTAGLAITPPTVEILLSPNKKIVQAFTLKNQGDSGDFTVSLHPFTPNGTEGHVIVDPQPLDPTSIPLVVTLENNDLKFGEPFALNKGGSVQIVLGLTGATTDLAEDSYLALVIESAAPESTNFSLAKPGISALIMATLTPSSVLPVDLSIENFELPLFHDTSSPLVLTPTVNNNSPVMLRPQGSLEIFSPQGRHNQTVKLYPNLILRNSSRLLTADCQTKESNPPQVCPLTYRPAWYNLGPYKLRLTVTTQGGTKLSEVERVVWLFPLKAGIMIVAVLAILIAVVAYKNRKTV